MPPRSYRCDVRTQRTAMYSAVVDPLTEGNGRAHRNFLGSGGRVFESSCRQGRPPPCTGAHPLYRTAAGGGRKRNTRFSSLPATPHVTADVYVHATDHFRSSLASRRVRCSTVPIFSCHTTDRFSFPPRTKTRP